MNKTIRILLTILLLAITVYIFALSYEYIKIGINFIFKIIFPFLIAFVVAFILQPVVSFLTNKLKKRWIAVLIVLISFIAIIYFICYSTFPFLIQEIDELSLKMPSLLLELEEILNNFGEKFSFLPDNYKPTFDNINAIFNKYFEGISLLPERILGKIFNIASTVIIIPMILIYFLLDYEKIICCFREKLIQKNKINLKNYLGEIHQMMSSYFRGAFLIMFILTILSTIAFSFIGLDFALFFGLICGITDIIPYLGPYLGGVLPVLYALIISPKKALLVILIIVIVQTIESMFLSPYIYGKQTNIHPLVVLISLSIFGALFGIFGMLIAVPVCSIIKITIKYYPFFKASNKKLEEYNSNR